MYPPLTSREGAPGRRELETRGLAVVDLPFEDCSLPPPDVVSRFLAVAERVPGALAVHGRGGLGRTGTLVALYMMKHHGFSAREAMGWLRIVRPGSVIGPQQQYLCEMEAVMRSAGDWSRRRRSVLGLATPALSGGADCGRTVLVPIPQTIPCAGGGRRDEADGGGGNSVAGGQAAATRTALPAGTEAAERQQGIRNPPSHRCPYSGPPTVAATWNNPAVPSQAASSPLGGRAGARLSAALMSGKSATPAHSKGATSAAPAPAGSTVLGNTAKPAAGPAATATALLGAGRTPAGTVQRRQRRSLSDLVPPKMGAGSGWARAVAAQGRR